MSIIARVRTFFERTRKVLLTDRQQIGQLERDRRRLLIVEETGFKKRGPETVWSEYWGKDWILFSRTEVRMHIRTIDTKLKELNPTTAAKLAA